MSQHIGPLLTRGVFAVFVVLAACSSDSDVGIDSDTLEADSDTLEADGGTRSDERLAMDAVFSDFTIDTPGCAVAVRLGDGDELAAQYGLADVERGDPITDDTLFDIGSVSKQMTAGAVAILIENGELDLDDDITDHIDELGPFDEVITIADLVHHTSGLPDYTELLDADDDDITTMADALDVIGSDDGQPIVGPGTEFEYSNTNYVLLATIVEQTTSMSMAEFSHTAIFEPLGMDETLVRDDQGALLDGQAQGYIDDDGEWLPAASFWRQTGDGAVHSTPLDLLRWTDSFLGEPAGQGLGSPEWLEIMTTPGPVADGDDGYGGGLEIVGSDDDLILQHGGSWTGYGSALVMQPSSGVAVAVACNIDGVDAEGLASSTFDIWTSAD